MLQLKNIKKSIALFFGSVALMLFLVPTSAWATPTEPVETTDAFVCPVLNETVGEHNPNAFGIGGGDYSLLPGGTESGSQSLEIPKRATNMDGDGSPPGVHSSPGDSDYTAIWGS